MSWTATGWLFGRPMTLTWADQIGSADWPGAVRRTVADPVLAGNAHVRLTVTGPWVRLDIDDPRAMSAWLAEQGMHLTGGLPRLDPMPDDTDA